MDSAIILIVGFYAFCVLGLLWAEFSQNLCAQYIFKPLAALGFCLIALKMGALESVYGQIILAGLVACAIGDIVLLSRTSEKLFTWGMVAFALGHMAYILAAFFVPHSILLPLYAGIPIMILCVLIPYFIWKHIKPKIPSKLKGAVAIYTVLISVMVFISAQKLNSPYWSVSLAAFLFAVSDFFVARDRFIKLDSKNAFVITPFYFGAQALFASSVGL